MADVVGVHHHLDAILYVIHVLLHAVSEKPTDIVVDLEVDLVDLYHGRTKRIIFARHWSICAPGSMQQQLWSYTTMESIYVNLVDPVPHYTFMGAGDREGTAAGDVVVNLRIKEHPTHKIDAIVCKQDLHTTLPLTLFDYLYGRTFDVAHLDGSTVTVEYPAQSGQRVRMFSDLGLPLPPAVTSEELCNKTERRWSNGNRGSWYIFFEVAMPQVPQNLLTNPWTRLTLAKLFC